ncbi:MAG: DNA polymerase III subunit beta [Candidatus Paceibacterota bacterium]|nr:DNA polymerase III subunit beta [Candidatus Paceibacterota bacterium]MDD4998864.1 DNA polymerase III subunit beta [Candidatus Paceibacterota bacterium]
MKFIALTENLKKAVNLAERITGKNLTLPILNNLLLETNKNKIHLSATDLELGIEITITGKTEKEGKFVLPAKTFSAFLNNLPEEKISLEKKDNTLSVFGGKYNSVFQGMNPEDFPIIPEIKTEKFIELEKNDLEEALEQIIPSISYSSLKPELNGVLLKLENGILKIVGTDSFRLAEKTIFNDKFKTNIKEDLEIIIPLRSSQELLRIIQEQIEEDSTKIKINPEINQVQFSTENIRLISRLINAEYPKYASIIPKNFEINIIFDKKDLLEAVKVVGLFSGRINDIHFNISPDKKEVVIEAQDISLGKSHATINPLEIKGKNLEINFNYRFILDSLNSIREEMVIINLNNELNPGLVKGKNDNSFIYILMPIKV